MICLTSVLTWWTCNYSVDKYVLSLQILMFVEFKVIRDRKSFLKLGFLLLTFSPVDYLYLRRTLPSCIFREITGNCIYFTDIFVCFQICYLKWFPVTESKTGQVSNSSRMCLNPPISLSQESISDFYWYYSGKDVIDEQGQRNFSKAIQVAKQVFNTLTEYIQVNL